MGKEVATAVKKHVYIDFLTLRFIGYRDLIEMQIQFPTQHSRHVNTFALAKAFQLQIKIFGRKCIITNFQM